MSIRLKLIVGCLGLTMVVFGLGLFARSSQQQIGTIATRIYDEALLSLSYLRSAQNSLVKLEADLRDRLDANAILKTAPRLQQDDPKQSAEIRLDDILGDLKVAADRAISPAGGQKVEEIRNRILHLRADRFVSTPAFLQTLKVIDNELDTAVEIFAGDGYRFRREVGDLIERADRQSQIALAGGVGGALIISVLLSTLIIPPVRRAVGIATAIASGKLDNEIRPSGGGETSQLLTALATMQTSIRELMAAQAASFGSQIALQNTRFDAALNNMSQGLCLIDAEGRLIIRNRRFEEMFCGGDDAPAAEAVLQDERYAALFDTGDPSGAIHALADGRRIAVSSEAVPGGGWVVTLEDFTERHRAEARLTHMTQHDLLTGLPNRRQFRERVAQALLRRRGGRNVAMLSINLDGFKAVNDLLGQPAGDALLQSVSARLLDLAGKGEFVARIGGDEFGIVKNLRLDERPDALAEGVLAALSQPFDLHGVPATVGASIGIALADELADGEAAVETLLKNADLALERAKSEGRSTYRFFEPEMDAQLQMRRKLELDLRGATDRGELELFYQPFVDVETQTITGFEALLRWTHPELGPVSPAEFIPVAEASGLIHAIGHWALLTACQEAATWPDDLVVSVNLSPVQFKNRALVHDVVGALTAAGLPAARLHLEVTESLFLQDGETVAAMLQAFREHGVGVSMDDFGTGYSSLGYLSRFPFDKIKIDQSFVRAVDQRDNHAIIRAVIGLGRAMDIAVIAEGVETAEQLAILRTAGCKEVQGYYFSRPRPSGEVAAAIRQFGTLHGRRTGGARSPHDRLAPAARLAAG
ncbi:EAL domain-containing protein [Aurantimonas sp. MSK8Z-1]|uniref:putative bifunctional diguanylate cyclase/phosphodiesterase n=1 Tax=Mangrovibrevibacter kandeliae TaxID=2968473 RepID=UPI0021174FC5|nr:EAL domain-containing protein [Aurantimonas sp. MSK8Z-1]MCW4116340.1 EAL domain-containing protein [Aurantimonas sp. MSK8Z-1]